MTMTESKCWRLDTSSLAVLYKPYLIIPTLPGNRFVFSEDGICAKVLRDFWWKWKNEYIVALRRYLKWKRPNNFQVGELRCCCRQRRQFSLITLASCPSCQDQPWSRWDGSCSHSQDQGWNLQTTSYQSCSSVAMWEITVTVLTRTYAPGRGAYKRRGCNIERVRFMR